MKHLMLIAAQCGDGSLNAPVFLFALLISVFILAAMWRVFTKAAGLGCSNPVLQRGADAENCGQAGLVAHFLFYPHH
jgi:hypothetical protein